MGAPTMEVCLVDFPLSVLERAKGEAEESSVGRAFTRNRLTCLRDGHILTL